MSMPVEIKPIVLSRKKQDLLDSLKHKYFIFDIETYPDAFTVVIQNAHKLDKARIYEISTRRNDARELVKALMFLQHNNFYMVGFNNVNFDWSILDYFINHMNPTWEGSKIAHLVWQKANLVINYTRDEQFANTIWPKDQLIKQVDLYRLNHFDNQAKSTSLKLLEYNMQLQNICDLPFPPNSRLNHEEIQVLCDYNVHDVYATTRFFFECLPAIQYRETVSAEYKRYAMNENDMAIGKKYFTKRLEQELGKDICFYKDENGVRHTRQTHRDQIVINDILFDCIKFKRPEFQAIHQFYKNQIITNTKGGFSDYPYLKVINDSTVVAPDKVVKRRGKEITVKGIEFNLTQYMDQLPIEKQLKSKKPDDVTVKHLHCIIDGVSYDFGMGGLHAAVQDTCVTVKANERMGEDDVGSMYPSIAIEHRLFPAHLGEEFVPILAEMKTLRMKAKKDMKNDNLSDSLKAKNKALSDMLKLAMNAGAFGDTNQEFSQFYDPQLTMSITINGQLMLAMLVERLLEIEGCRVVQANTDGVVSLFDKKHTPQYDQIINDWQEDTGLILEFTPYSKLFSKGVNDYIAIGTDGDVKKKGAYATKLELHKNWSALVVPKAVEAVLVEGVDLREFLENHNDVHDFTLRAKIPRSSKVISMVDIIDEVETPAGYEKLSIHLRYQLETVDRETMKEIVMSQVNAQGKLNKELRLANYYLKCGYELPKTVNGKQEQNISRYYIAQEGVELKKVMPELGHSKKKGDRYMSINSGYTVSICNDMKDFNRDNLNLDWYYDQAMKLIEPVKPKVVRRPRPKL